MLVRHILAAKQKLRRLLPTEDALLADLSDSAQLLNVNLQHALNAQRQALQLEIDAPRKDSEKTIIRTLR